MRTFEFRSSGIPSGGEVDSAHESLRLDVAFGACCRGATGMTADLDQVSVNHAEDHTLAKIARFERSLSRATATRGELNTSDLCEG